jgi:hypothetical protein
VRSAVKETPPVPEQVWAGRVSAGSSTLVPWDEGDLDSLLRRSEQDMSLRRSLRRRASAVEGSQNRRVDAPLTGQNTVDRTRWTMCRGPSKHEFEGPRRNCRRYVSGEPDPLRARNDVRTTCQPHGLGCKVAHMFWQLLRCGPREPPRRHPRLRSGCPGHVGPPISAPVATESCGLRRPMLRPLGVAPPHGLPHHCRTRRLRVTPEPLVAGGFLPVRPPFPVAWKFSTLADHPAQGLRRQNLEQTRSAAVPAGSVVLQQFSSLCPTC